VALTWEPVADAVGYRVWRSLLSGGGYAPVADVTDPAFIDETVRDGAAVHYVITALDAAGNVSARSVEAAALPQLTITEVRLDAPDALTATRSAVEPGPAVDLTVTVTDAPGGVLQGLRAQVGVGPVGSDPTTDSRWTWVDAAPVAEDAATATGTFRAAVPATTTGDQDGAARASADAGATWTTGAGTGRLTVTPAADTEAPPAPGAPEAIDVADDHVTLRWAGVTADDLFGYQVLRGKGADGPLTPLAVTPTARYTDTSVVAGHTYRYAIVALDTALNASEPGPALTVVAKLRIVPVTFTVTLPEGTPATDTIYIAGDFQSWSPGSTPMTQVDATHWTITIEFEDATPLQYKYTRGSWEAVEKDAGCGENENKG